MSESEAPELPLDSDGNPLMFETALAELETLVGQMEAGELSLEDSVTCFERGMTLHQFCQQALEQAETKVDVLVRQSRAPADGDLEPFTSDE